MTRNARATAGKQRKVAKPATAAEQKKAAAALAKYLADPGEACPWPALGAARAPTVRGGLPAGRCRAQRPCRQAVWCCRLAPGPGALGESHGFQPSARGTLAL